MRVLFASPEAARAAALALAGEAGWAWARQTAEAWSVVPQLAERIETLGLGPPAEQREAIKRSLIEVFARSAARGRKGALALERLRTAGIPAVAFKGLASMARLYPTPGNRSIRDTDILVEPGRVREALDELAALQFTCPDGHDLERWDRFLDNSPGFSGNKALVLAEPGGIEIDLHWSLGLEGMEPEQLLARGEVLPLFGCRVPVVSTGDGMLLTARHAIRDNLAVDAVCRDLFDIRESCRWLAAEGTLTSVIEGLAGRPGAVPVLALTRILTTLAGGGDVERAARTLESLVPARDQLAARRLEQLFFHQVTEGPIGRDLLYLAHARPLAQILRGALGNWGEYRNFMRAMEEKWDGEEVSLGSRVRGMMSALKQTGPRQWRALRALGREKFDAGG